MEWAKAKARAARWTEEVELVYEEMRRTIEYCRWRAKWWESQSAIRKDVSPELADGLSVYALEHADLESRMERDLESRWEAIRSRARALMDSNFEEKTGDDTGSDSATLPPQPETVFLNLRDLQVLVDDEGEDEEVEVDEDDEDDDH